MPDSAAGPIHPSARPKPKRAPHPFRGAVLRGLAVVAPPLLTIVIFIWIGGTINQYVLRPLTTTAADVVAWSISDIQEQIPGAAPDQRTVTRGQRVYYRLDSDQYVPQYVYDTVKRDQGDEPLPQTGDAVYRRYVELKYLKPYTVIPAFLAVFILLLYLMGKSMAVRIGHIFVGTFERGVDRLPVVRNVYSSVKQVSEFFFSPREMEFTRVVVVEYPRKGIWSLGFVTSESMADIRSAANEPVLALLIPTSPMPVTGYTVTVLQSEAIDLNITIDQAFQFIISCGVVVPPHQLQEVLGPAKPGNQDAHDQLTRAPS